MPGRASSVKTDSNQPRFTPSQDSHLPPPAAPLTDAQTATLDALRTYIHDSVAKTTSQKNWADDECLVRYLRGRKWNLQEAKQAVQDSITWRESYRPNAPEKNEIWIETAPGKLYVSGFDRESRPLLYMKPRLENTAASAAQVRNVVFNLETAIALMPKGVQNLCIISDFAGSSMTRNPGVGVARDIINILGSHYPERLGKAYIINAPWFFFTFYKLVSPFIDPVTRAKINFVDMKKQKPRSMVSTPSSATTSEVDLSNTSESKKSTEGAAGQQNSDNVNLLDVIPEDMLERDFGGSSDYVYDQDAYWTASMQVLKDSRDALERGQEA